MRNIGKRVGSTGQKCSRMAVNGVFLVFTIVALQIAEKKEKNSLAIHLRSRKKQNTLAIHFINFTVSVRDLSLSGSKPTVPLCSKGEAHTC